jgi:hypothetical protein
MALLLVGCGGARRSGSQPQYAVVGNGVEVWVTSAGGRLPLYPHEGALYLLGQVGQQYQLCIGNRLATPVEAVVSVDGRDVVSGQPADYRRDRGYVLLSGEQVCVEGFRQSLNEVAAFEFTPRENSYAARMGDDANAGVIGVALFDPAQPAPPAVIASGDDGAPVTAPPADARAHARMAEEGESADMGTAYGQPVSSAAEIVEFIRLDPEHPREIVSFYYSDRAGLEAMGIEVTEEAPAPLVQPRPDPFPAASNSNDFAPPPPSS